MQGKWGGIVVGVAAVFGCHAPGVDLIPDPLPVVASGRAMTWAKATVPSDHLLYRFRWHLTREKGDAGGAGSVRFAPPDSIRIDMAGPFGTHRSAAVVVGDSTIWVQPSDALEGWLPAYSLLWATLGIGRIPEGWSCPTGAQGPQGARWRCFEGQDTVALGAWTRDLRRFQVELHRAGRLVGVVVTHTGHGGLVERSELTVPDPASRLTVTMKSGAVVPGFPATVWASPVGD